VQDLIAPVPPRPDEVDRAVINHARMAQSLARSLQQIGSQDEPSPLHEAFELLREVVELFTAWYGQTNEQSTMSRQELGDALAGAEYFDDAEPVMRLVLRDRLEAHGEEHEYTQVVQPVPVRYDLCLCT